MGHRRPQESALGPVHEMTTSTSCPPGEPLPRRCPLILGDSVGATAKLHVLWLLSAFLIISGQESQWVEVRKGP